MNTESHQAENHGSAEQNAQAATLVPGLSEDAALALLKSSEATAESLAQLAKNPITSKSRKVMVALIAHPRTPRHISIPLLRSMFTFDLMNTALTAAIAPDIKRAAEEQILTRLESLPLSQKITLARRASGRVAAALLNGADRRVILTALDNARMTEVLMVQALMKPNVSQTVFALVSEHSKWSQRREIQIALLRSEKTPLEQAQEFGKHFSTEFLQEIVPENRKSLLVPNFEEPAE